VARPDSGAVSESRIVAGALTAVALALLALTLGLRSPARLAPMAVLLPSCALLLIEVGRLWRRPTVPPALPVAARAREARRVARPPQGGADQRRRELTFVGWLAGVVAGSLLLGPGAAVPLFLLFWFLAQARQGWLVGLAVATPAALLVDVLLPWGLGIRLPPGLIGGVLLP
jgi:hypothetical protein